MWRFYHLEMWPLVCVMGEALSICYLINLIILLKQTEAIQGFILIGNCVQYTSLCISCTAFYFQSANIIISCLQHSFILENGQNGVKNTSIYHRFREFDLPRRESYQSVARVCATNIVPNDHVVYIHRINSLDGFWMWSSNYYPGNCRKKYYEGNFRDFCMNAKKPFYRIRVEWGIFENCISTGFNSQMYLCGNSNVIVQNYMR